jgi:adenosylhomocysteine nucleosidase
VGRVAIFAALQWECRPVLQQLRQVSRQRAGDCTFWCGSTPRAEVVLVKTGMGIVRAEAAARAVGASGMFDLFLSTGCSGALAAELVPGDVTVATAVVDRQTGGGIDTHPQQSERARRAAERAALRVRSGRVLCSPQVLASAADKRAAAAQHGAVAVEMEGAAIAALAAERSIPFISVRAVLDTADTELRHAGRFLDPQTGAVKPLVLAGYLATHPSALADLRAMQRMMRAAQTSLERFFTEWFSILDSRL